MNGRNSQMRRYFEIIVPLKEAQNFCDDIDSEGWKLKDYKAFGTGTNKIIMIISLPPDEVNYFKVEI